MEPTPKLIEADRAVKVYLRLAILGEVEGLADHLNS